METLPDILALLIPVLALLIGLVIIAGIFLVQPLVRAISRLAEVRQGGSLEVLPAATARLEERVAMLESTLEKVLEEREFERQLRAGQPATPAVAPGPEELPIQPS